METIGRDYRGSWPLGIVVVLTLLAAAVLVGCGSSKESKNVTPSSSKPDLPDLSDGMVITESDFPKVPDGKFMFTPVRTLDSASDTDAKCDLKMDQEAGARVISDSTHTKYAIEIFHTQAKKDLESWVSDCLPLPKNEVTNRTDLPGLPPGTISFSYMTTSDGETTESHAFGYSRGILIHAYIRAGSDGMPAGAKSDLVKIFVNQAEQLESY